MEVDSVDAECGVHIDEQRVVVDGHRVQLERVEHQGVAGRGDGLAEQLAHGLGDIQLHLRGQLAAEEWDKEKVEFARVAGALDARVAEADGRTFGLRDKRDIGVCGERDAETRALEAGAQFGMRAYMHPDAVVLEGDLRLLGVDIACGCWAAPYVVAAFSPAEELGLQRALQRLRRDLYLDGASRQRGGRTQRQQQKSTTKHTSHS